MNAQAPEKPTGATMVVTGKLVNTGAIVSKLPIDLRTKSGEVSTIDNQKGGDIKTPFLNVDANTLLNNDGNIYVTGGYFAVPVESFAISPASVNVGVGFSTTLSVGSFLPSDASTKDVTWSITSGAEYVSIDVTPGNPNVCVVTAIGLGQATITATSVDQNAKTASCTVNTDFTPVLVSNFRVYGQTSETATAGVDESITLQAFLFTPSNASHKTVTWIPEIGYEEFATFTTNSNFPNSCYITGKKAGSFSLDVTNYDENVTKTLTVTITADKIYGSVTGKNATYRTYTYPGDIGTYMVDNSKEGDFTSTTYPGHESGERGYYYTWENAPTACPDGFELPSPADFDRLHTWFTTTQWQLREGMLHLPDAAFGGEYREPNTWGAWENRSTWWGSAFEAYQSWFQDSGFAMVKVDLSADPEQSRRLKSVRCIKKTE
ncbi:hypothetical protein FACS189421_00730 [Bacteroidia bacterium]|nr:hypothetical protein FACS189421_00730 [Bacteroidia bacterium]